MTATISSDGKHRYTLTRDALPLGAGAPASLGCVLFVMLNPSTADASKDDPTIRKCKGFATRWGYGALEVVNLFSFRATKPKDLWASSESNREESDSYVLGAVDRATQVVAAWGEQPKAYVRARNVTLLILNRLSMNGKPRRIFCIGPLTGGGNPRHPLMLGYANELVPYVERT